MTEEKKKDLIDLVREGKQIEIYEAGKELKEGDVIRDWKVYKGTVEDRRVLGKLVYIFKQTLIHLFPCLCRYCGTQLHAEIDENRDSRVGKDGRTYYRFWKSRIGVVCPLCEYRHFSDDPFHY